MDLLADLDDVAALLGRDLDDAEVGMALRLLELASDGVRSHTGQVFDFVADDTVTIEPDLEGHLWLPQRPVTAVTSVTVMGTTLGPTAYGWARDGLLAHSYWSGNAQVPWTLYPATVVYSHGYTELPGDVRLATAELVATSMANPSGIVSESLGVYSVRYLNNRSPGVSLTAEVEQRLRRYKRRPSSLPIYVAPFPSGFHGTVTGYPTP
jgi:hypothetical protein